MERVWGICAVLALLAVPFKAAEAGFLTANAQKLGTGTGLAALFGDKDSVAATCADTAKLNETARASCEDIRNTLKDITTQRPKEKDEAWQKRFGLGLVTIRQSYLAVGNTLTEKDQDTLITEATQAFRNLETTFRNNVAKSGGVMGIGDSTDKNKNRVTEMFADVRYFARSDFAKLGDARDQIEKDKQALVKDNTALSQNLRAFSCAFEGGLCKGLDTLARAKCGEEESLQVCFKEISRSVQGLERAADQYASCQTMAKSRNAKITTDQLLQECKVFDARYTEAGGALLSAIPRLAESGKLTAEEAKTVTELLKAAQGKVESAALKQKFTDAIDGVGKGLEKFNLKGGASSADVGEKLKAGKFDDTAEGRAQRKFAVLNALKNYDCSYAPGSARIIEVPVTAKDDGSSCSISATGEMPKDVAASGKGRKRVAGKTGTAQLAELLNGTTKAVKGCRPQICEAKVDCRMRPGAEAALPKTLSFNAACGAESLVTACGEQPKDPKDEAAKKKISNDLQACFSSNVEIFKPDTKVVRSGAGAQATEQYSNSAN